MSHCTRLQAAKLDSRDRSGMEVIRRRPTIVSHGQRVLLDEILQVDKMVKLFAIITVISLGGSIVTNTSAESDIPYLEVSNWAVRFGAQLWEIGKQATRSREIKERYAADARVEVVDGLTLLKEISQDLENMMSDKVDAIKRIMDAAENVAMAYQPEDDRNMPYYNVKRLNEQFQGNATAAKIYELSGLRELALVRSRIFGNAEVNTSVSAVHVPTNVYDGIPAVMNGILWSDQLDRIFESNHNSDPSLSWQFFGSSTGFMRQYPASKWANGEMEPDLFDCRLRPWYLQAAASPKDLFILVDTSGSMTGVRKEIAKHVVLTLLDTLSENDYVNIYRFNDSLIPIVSCFEDKLVQANLENIKELKMGMENLETKGISNFTSALTTAFEILGKYNKTKQGAQCNQAIMLVTDGAPLPYQEIFEKYNSPHRPVRMFTYLIGREIADQHNLIAMSRDNKGFFVHVTTMAEVREQVLKYIPVLSRPMVMYQKDHPIVWTPIYADLADKTKQKYRMVTSVATPVFDRKNYSNITERILINDAWVERTRTARTANLLGVAGTDIAISDLIKRIPAYKLGANGYSFIINNNGYLLHHPDFRPVVSD